jgi:hypothetical protein
MASTFIPAGAPPPGVIPNFDNPPDTLYTAMVTATALSISLTTVFTAARLVARLSIAQRPFVGFSIDDCGVISRAFLSFLLFAGLLTSSADLLIVAWALNVGYNALFIWQAQTGIGRHVWDVLATDAIKIAQVCVHAHEGPALFPDVVALGNYLADPCVHLPAKLGPGIALLRGYVDSQGGAFVPTATNLCADQDGCGLHYGPSSHLGKSRFLLCDLSRGAV